MKTVLICHEDARLDQLGLAGWLASFSELAGIIVLREPRQRMWQRVRREYRRSGLVRFADVLAFRVYYRLSLAKRDRAWEEAEVNRLTRLYPAPALAPRVCVTSSPNSPEAKAFLAELEPDVVLARCKTLLKPDVFTIPRLGTYVLHPGMCPEYRNAHGCFWALANNEPQKVAVTLLRIDAGIDTGPVFGYYTCEFDSVQESHVVIQARSLTANLDAIRRKFAEIELGTAQPLETRGRASAVWGQPWLTKYFCWKSTARREAHASCQPALS
ncbi:MAG: formyltransferase family protein [Planctomycetaceae bacterium]